MPIERSTVVPAAEAVALEVPRGRRFRVVAHEGPQVCDAVFVNAADHEETFSSDMSVFVNAAKSTGDLWQITELYSRPPGMRRMATVTEDRIGHHFPWAGGMCCPLLYELRDDDPEHPNCAENLLGALRGAGLDYSRVPEVFNVGMNVTVEGDAVAYEPPEFGAGDYVEFEAEMDLVVAISACPNDVSVINEGEPKPLRVDVLE